MIDLPLYGPKFCIELQSSALNVFELHVTTAIMKRWRFSAERYMGSGGPVYAVTIGRLRVTFWAWVIPWWCDVHFTTEQILDQEKRLRQFRKERFGE